MGSAAWGRTEAGGPEPSPLRCDRGRQPAGPRRPDGLGRSSLPRDGRGKNKGKKRKEKKTIKEKQKKRGKRGGKKRREKRKRKEKDTEKGKKEL